VRSPARIIRAALAGLYRAWRDFDRQRCNKPASAAQLNAGPPPVPIAERPQLMSARREIGKAHTGCHVFVVELGVQPCRLGYLQSPPDWTGRVPVDERDRHAVHRQDVPGPQIAMTDDGVSHVQRPALPRHPVGVR